MNIKFHLNINSFLFRLLQRCPSEFLKSNIICPIIEHIIPNCHLEHRDASASMMAFLQSLVKLSSASKKENKVIFDFFRHEIKTFIELSF